MRATHGEEGLMHIEATMIIGLFLAFVIFGIPLLGHHVPVVYPYTKKDITVHAGKLYIADGDILRTPQTKDDRKLLKALSEKKVDKIYCRISNIPHEQVHSCSKKKHGFQF